MLYLITLLLFFQQDDTPLKPKVEYTANINFQFKPHPSTPGSGSNQKIRFVESTLPVPETAKYAGGNYPYVKLNLVLVKLSDEEVKMKITQSDGNTVYNKKVKQGAIVTIDLGFVDDLKDVATNTEFDCILMSDKKAKTSRIHIVVEKDGTYLVNGTKLGKF